MPSSRVNITFTGSASPYTSGDKASFPIEKARAFIRRGVAVFTNPDLQGTEKAIRRTRLGEHEERPHSIHGSTTSGKDFKSPPDEFDLAMRGGPMTDKDGLSLDEALEDPGLGIKRDNRIDPRLRQAGGEGGGSVSTDARLGTQESHGHTTHVGQKTDEDSKVYDAGAKTAAENAARAAGLDPTEAGDAVEKARQAERGDIAKEKRNEIDFSDQGGKSNQRTGTADEHTGEGAADVAAHGAGVPDEGEEGDEEHEVDEDDDSGASDGGAEVKVRKTGKAGKSKTRTRL